MGCVENRKQIRIAKNLTNKKSLIFLKYRNSISLKDKFSTVCNSEEGINKIFINKSDKITNQLWLNILDYLNYKELKETGKVNRMFNNNVKQKEILVKFFKKEILFIQIIQIIYFLFLFYKKIIVLNMIYLLVNLFFLIIINVILINVSKIN